MEPAETMAEISITLAEDAAGGRYAGRVSGIDGEAELTYRRSGPDRVIAGHTYAPPVMRGTGVAKAMVERLVADARKSGFKIVPACSYVQDQAGRHPEWADVVLSR